MNKEEFSNLISETQDIPKSEANKIINIFTDSVAKALSQKQPINLIGFGTFDILHTKAREGRNPSTGQPIQIKASNRPTFKAGKKLKDAVN